MTHEQNAFPGVTTKLLAPHADRVLIAMEGARERLVPILGTPINMLNLPKGCAFCPRCDEAMKICLEEVPEEVFINENHKAACWINIRDGKTMAGKENGDE